MGQKRVEERLKDLNEAMAQEKLNHDQRIAWMKEAIEIQKAFNSDDFYHAADLMSGIAGSIGDINEAAGKFLSGAADLYNSLGAIGERFTAGAGFGEKINGFTNFDSIAGHYFSILNVDFYDLHNNKIIEGETPLERTSYVVYTVLNKSTNDTLFMPVRNGDSHIQYRLLTVEYYEKMKNMLLIMSFFCTKDAQRINYSSSQKEFHIDINTEEKIILKKR